MALDGIFLSLLKNELRDRCIGARVDKIFQPARDELIFLLRGYKDRESGGRLLISARPSGARVHLTETSPENPPAPPMFCMLLRKKLTGAALSGIRQEGLDRVLYLDFSGRDELGDPASYTVAAELLGRQPGILLLDGENRIIDAAQRSSAEARRLLMPGAAYVPPPAEEKHNLLTDAVESVVESICKKPAELSQAIRQSAEGVSPLIAREIAYLTVGDAQISADSLDGASAARLRAALEKHRALCEAGGQPHLYSRDGGPFEFTYRPLSQYGVGAEGRACDSYSLLLDAFYAGRDRQERLRAAARDTLKLLSAATERVSRKINLRQSELKGCENREQQRIYGELIKANLHAIPRGAAFCEVPNYYEPDCPAVRIPLNPAYSPAENGQRYFKAYRKASTAAQLLLSLIEEARAELAYLETVSDALARAESEREIAEIRDELAAAGYLRRAPLRQTPGKKPPKKSRAAALLPPLRFEKDGFEILVGRNNRQNDQLTMKTADAKDLWFHTKTVPGSHVILRTGGVNPPDAVLREAALLAARHSAAKDSGGAEVDYTQARYVKKPPGAKPGMVTYEKYRTVYVRL